MTSQKWLILADAQPITTNDRSNWRRIQDGLGQYYDDVNFVVFAGDLVHRGYPVLGGCETLSDYYMFGDFIADWKSRTSFAEKTFFLNGNHDRNYLHYADSVDGRTFNDYLRRFPKLFYHVIVGNLLLIFMGPMSPATGADIPIEVFQWWRGLVRQHQDKIVITVTHQPLSGTTDNTSDEAGCIHDGARFKSIMADVASRNDLWFAGHVGPADGKDYLDDGVVGWIEAFDTFHVQCGMHLGDQGDTITSGWRPTCIMMEINDGSDEIALSRIDLNDFSIGATTTRTVRNKASLSAIPSFDGRYQSDDRNQIKSVAQNVGVQNNAIYIDALRAENSPEVWAVPASVQWSLGISTTDRYQSDIPAGHGVGFGLGIAGSDYPTNDALLTWGWGGGVAACRASGSDEDYSANISLYASGPGQGPSSLFPVWSAGANTHVFLSASGETQALRVNADNTIVGARTSASTANPGTGVVLNAAGGLQIFRAATSGTFQTFYHSAGGTPIPVGAITYNSTTTTYGTSSDRRLKLNFDLLDGSLDVITAIKVYEGEYERDAGVRHTYVIADEMQELIPDAVSGEPNATEEIGTIYEPTAIGEFYDLVQPENCGASDPIAQEVTVVIESDVWHDDERRGNGYPYRWRQTGVALRAIEHGVPASWAAPHQTWEKTGERPIYQMVDYSKVVPRLIGAIQELSAKVSDLTKR